MVENKYIEWIKHHSAFISHKINDDCDIAKDIAGYCGMYKRCPDGMTLVLIEEKVKELQQKYNRY